MGKSLIDAATMRRIRWHKRCARSGSFTPRRECLLEPQLLQRLRNICPVRIVRPGVAVIELVASEGLPCSSPNDKSARVARQVNGEDVFHLQRRGHERHNVVSAHRLASPTPSVRIGQAGCLAVRS
jgi:hypothetical protein